MKILLMGGTQFIGRAIAKRLLEKHHVEIFTRGMLPLDYDVIHHQGDRFCDEDLKKLDKSYDVIVDVSAYEGEAISKLLTHTKTNHYLLISSGAVYAPTEERLTEDHALGENSHWGGYGLNKLSCEEVLQDHKHTIFRPSYIYGPGNNLYRQGYFMDCIREQEPIFLPEGHARIQLVHIDDVTAAVAYAIEHTITGIFNLTCEEDLTFEDICRGLMKTMAQKTDLVTVDQATMDALEINQVRQFFPYRNVTYLMDGSNWYKHLQPSVNLAQGLKTLVTMDHPLKDPSMNKIQALRDHYHD